MQLCLQLDIVTASSPVYRHTVEADAEADLTALAHSASILDHEADEVYANEDGLVFFDGEKPKSMQLEYAAQVCSCDMTPETRPSSKAWAVPMPRRGCFFFAQLRWHHMLYSCMLVFGMIYDLGSRFWGLLHD